MALAIGIRPCRVKPSRRSISYRANDSAKGLRARVDAGHQQLLRPDDRRHDGHAGGGIRPAVRRPLALGLGDRIDGERS